MADGGTLFLDEIGDMPLSLQAKLLRFLQGRVIERVGGREEIPVNVRVVCATNKDLQAQIAAQQFRQDLYFRISEVIINVPPLRDRPGGTTVLAHSFLRKFGGLHGRPKRGFSEEAIAALRNSSTSNALFRSRGTGYTACVTVVAAEERRPTCTTCGRRRYLRASASTSGAIVALKSSVCL